MKSCPIGEACESHLKAPFFDKFKLTLQRFLGQLRSGRLKANELMFATLFVPGCSGRKRLSDSDLGSLELEESDIRGDLF
jgi:hypothetical protein